MPKPKESIQEKRKPVETKDVDHARHTEIKKQLKTRPRERTIPPNK